jgi:hypothetical protein
MRNVAGKSCRENKNTHFVFTNFLKFQLFSRTVRSSVCNILRCIYDRMMHRDLQRVNNLRSIHCTKTSLERLMRSVQSMHASPVLHTNPLTPELNSSAQRCGTRFFTGDFASLTVHFVNICVKNQQIYQLFIQFINYVW